MTLPARYSGVCPECGDRWQPGDLIRADEDRQWKHAVCPDDTDDLAHGEVCDRCWLTKPCDCEGAR